MAIGQHMKMPGKAIYELIAEAVQHEQHARRSDRHPFFRPVSIRTADNHRYSAFSRDISAVGIGLLHNFQMPVGEVDVAISKPQGYSVPVRVRIAWCESCGEGWYLSGGEFLGIAPPGALDYKKLD
jgi:hypothetical protein